LVEKKFKQDIPVSESVVKEGKKKVNHECLLTGYVLDDAKLKEILEKSYLSQNELSNLCQTIECFINKKMSNPDKINSGISLIMSNIGPHLGTLHANASCLKTIVSYHKAVGDQLGKG